MAVLLNVFLKRIAHEAPAANVAHTGNKRKKAVLHRNASLSDQRFVLPFAAEHVRIADKERHGPRHGLAPPDGGIAEQSRVVQRIGKDHAQPQRQQREERGVEALAHALAHPVGGKIDRENGHRDGGAEQMQAADGRSGLVQLERADDARNAEDLAQAEHKRHGKRHQHALSKAPGDAVNPAMYHLEKNSG